MSNTFLRHVATDILAKYGHDLSKTAVVFPNKRASLFLNQEFAELTANPMWAPTYLTISDLFRRHSEMQVGDSIKLICDLHKSFVKITGSNETIDHFFGWGKLLLADFDDIDKNMADADMIFRNITNLHELDDISYLTQEQREVLKSFFSNFTDDNESELKKRFIDLWKHFGNIYHDFNDRLAKQQLAYEGALYRSVVENGIDDFAFDNYIFVGFNFLHEVEKKLFLKIKKEGKAKFYWDFDEYYLASNTRIENEAGHFIKQYLELFPNELDNRNADIYRNFSKIKQISLVNAPTDTVQTAYMTGWLNNARIADGRHTAVVMCDETILQTVIHAFPESLEDVNVTIGYPLQQTPIVSFVHHLIALQTIAHKPGSNKYMLNYVLKVLRHPYAERLSGKVSELITTLTSNNLYFPTRTDLCIDEGMELVFRELADATKTKSANYKDDPAYSQTLFLWIQEIIQKVGKTFCNEEALTAESVFNMYTIVSRLLSLMQTGDLAANLSTMQRLLNNLVSTTSIPFHGEPIQGIQVMGVLETRNLDFDHLLILSCNEGNMPKGVDDSSFIPYSIRKAYGLTTIDHKVAIYAYYFYRLLQRAGDITIMYTSSADSKRPSEKSRFITQLMVESNIKIDNYNLQSPIISTAPHQLCIEKTPELMQSLLSIKKLSPTAINKYLRCPLTFYYYNILHISDNDNDESAELDNRAFGNIFHKAAELLYKQYNDNGTITEKIIAHILKSPNIVETIVDRAFAEELFKSKSPSFRPEYNGLQLISRSVIIGYIKNLLNFDRQMTPFNILGLELPIFKEYEMQVNGEPHVIQIGGTIDRLDLVSTPTGKTIRVIDYKTSKKADPKVKSVADMFARTNIDDTHSNYVLQAMLYSLIVSEKPDINPQKYPVSPALLFIQHAMGKDYDPTIALDKETINDVEPLRNEYEQCLKSVLEEIYNPNVSFVSTDDKGLCERCPYAQLCNI